ncbi:MAG: PaaI family thioesterase [Candidatus Methanoplasma sp.]|nr:PaaI family thioesterase [Candidatus Methanoplasma sp.]
MDIEALRGLVDPELHDWLDDILRMCNAPYAIDNKIELVSVSKEAVRMRKEVTPRDLNSNGVVHGAVSFGLIDHAFAVIGNIDTQSVGLSCNIIYHRPCFGSMLEAEARLVNESRTLITVDVSLRSENRLIASASCIGFKGERPKR